MNHSQKTKRRLTAIVLALFLFSNIFTGVFLYEPKPARAQWSIIASIPDALKKVWSTIEDVAVMGFLTTANNLITMTLQQLAYDLAEVAATGSPGQGSVFSQDGWSNFGDKVAGEAFGSINETLNAATGGKLSELGLDLCNPNPQLLLNIQIGLAVEGKFTRPEPQCDWNDIKSNWSSLKDEMDNGEILKRVGASFEPSNNDMGIALGINDKILTDIDKEKTAATNERIEGQGWLPAKSIIAGDVQTPAQMVKKEMEKQGDKADKTLDAQISALYNNMSFKNYGVLTLSVFLNTFLSKSLERIMSGILSPYSALNLEDPEASDRDNKKSFQEGFKDYDDMKRTQPVDYDLLSMFSTCPPDNARGINNCVMDTDLAEAVRRAQSGEPMTVQRAMDEGLLKPNGIFGYIKGNIEPDYQEGYGFNNIKKMRLARIVPLGWEIAAKEVYSLLYANSSQLYTLKQVVSGFSDPQSNFYNLVDPNWILKYPPMQCGRLGYGATLTSTSGNEREEYCYDVQHCVSENDDGTCNGGQDSWGYCFQEKNIWRFSGESCPKIYDSCKTFTKISGGEEISVSYLEKTMDPGACDADSAGCRWYSSVQKKDKDGNWVWKDADRLYFNNKVASCDATNEGCSRFIDKDEAAVNLVRNSSFEDGNNGLPENWNGSNTYYSTDGSESFIGEDVVRGDSSNYFTQTVSLKKNTDYVFSGYARKTDTETATKASIELRLGNGGVSVEAVLEGNELSDQTYNRMWKTFNSGNNDTAYIYVGSTKLSAANGGIWFDAIQLEEGTEPSGYHEGYYASEDETYLKKAPDYYNCEGYTKPVAGVANNANCAELGYFWREDIGECVLSGDDACSKFALYCSSGDVGCQSYTPVKGNIKVAGIVSDGDTCPAQCVGYKIYKQEETAFSEEVPAVEILPTAETGTLVCSKENAGCDEFTNLDKNEQVEYFSYLRECKKIKDADADCASFYTWEGSEQTGYTLDTYYLQKNGAEPEVTKAETAQECSEQIYKNGGNPDCKIFYNDKGETSYHLYSRTITCSDACSSYRKTDLDVNAAVGQASDCVQPNWHWQSDSSQCVYCPDRNWDNGECVYRGIAEEGTSCPAEMKGCREYKGTTSGNKNIIFEDSFEGGDVGMWQAVKNISLSNSLEAVNPSQHSLKAAPSAEGKMARPLSLSWDIVQGRTYFLSFWAKSPDGTELDIGLGEETLNADKKISSISEKIYFDHEDNDLSKSADTTNISSLWRSYQLGPLVADWENMKDPVLFVSGIDKEVYIDHIKLEEVPDSLYLIKDSWTIPQICDEPYAGAQIGCEAYRDAYGTPIYLKSFSRLCREELVGCRAFIDTNNNESRSEEIFNGQDDPHSKVVIPPDEPIYLVDSPKKQCKADQKGCMAVGKPTLADLIEPTDEKVSCDLGDACKDSGECDQKANCKKDGGCECKNGGLSCTVEKGKGYCEVWETLYLKNDPLKYPTTLCSYETSGCEKFVSDSGTKYFKDQSDRVCEYKEITQDGEIIKGWFKKGTNETCYDPQIIAENYYPIFYYGSAGYDNWVGECPERYNMCVRFVDPQDTNNINCDTDADCQDGMSCVSKGSSKICQGTYYYIDDEKIKDSEAECNEVGGASLGTGCVLFYKDTVDTQSKKYNSVETYKESKAKNYLPVSPIKSGTLDTNILLKVNKDRVCADWLTCYQKASGWDSRTGEDETFCQGLRAMYSSGFDSVTLDEYKKRNSSATGKEGLDYSGYALYTSSNLIGSYNCSVSGCTYKGKDMCKGYPEMDSPFPNTVNEQYGREINICYTGGANCECSYTKAQADGTEIYYKKGQAPSSMCVRSGDLDGQTCSEKKNCSTDPNSAAACVKPATKDYNGWWGDCLEEDTSKTIGQSGVYPCLTWMPIDKDPEGVVENLVGTNVKSNSNLVNQNEGNSGLVNTNQISFSQ